MTGLEQRFVAINVGSGDAFFLQRGGFSALVDGGLVNGFPVQFSRATQRSQVDVLVCTHNDQDHANGVLEFLDAGYGVGECWLPATWMEALRHILPGYTEETLFNLLLEPEGGDRPLPERVERGEDLIDARGLDAMLDDEAEQDPAFDDGLLNVCSGVAVLWRHGGLAVMQPRSSDIFAHATRIRRIALAAARRQIPIKWFDPSTPPTDPLGGPLGVVNAKQVTAIRRTVLSPRDVIRLTQVNRDSLVLYSPVDEVAPGVLFSADSGFAFRVPLPASRGMIVTAPHHGAADPENVAAYDRLKREHAALSETWTWVRSDRGTRVGHSRPCDQYRDQTKRFCTRCRGGGSVGQDVILVGGAHSWSSMGSPLCDCTER